MPQARAKKVDFKTIGERRRKAGTNQSAYWSRFGVTQSGGSRYESGRSVPTPTAMLMWLRETDQITDAQLDAAKKAVAKR